MMKSEELLDHFEQLAEQMGINLIEGKGDFEGGFCMVNDDQFVVLNKSRPLSQRLRILGDSFSKLDIGDRYILPALREFIEIEEAVE